MQSSSLRLLSRLQPFWPGWTPPAPSPSAAPLPLWRCWRAMMRMSTWSGYGLTTIYLECMCSCWVILWVSDGFLNALLNSPSQPESMIQNAFNTPAKTQMPMQHKFRSSKRLNLARKSGLLILSANLSFPQ